MGVVFIRNEETVQKVHLDITDGESPEVSLEVQKLSRHLTVHACRDICTSTYAPFNNEFILRFLSYPHQDHASKHFTTRYILIFTECPELFLQIFIDSKCCSISHT